MSGDLEVSLRLLAIELPAWPGTRLKVLVLDGEHGFFGPGGVRFGEGYSVMVNGELWRAVLETVRRVEGGTEIDLKIEGRYPAGGPREAQV